MVSHCFPLMTVKTEPDTEGTTDPHVAAQFLQHLPAPERTRRATRVAGFVQPSRDCGILSGVFVFCITTLML